MPVTVSATAVEASLSGLMQECFTLKYITIFQTENELYMGSDYLMQKSG